MPFSTTFSWQTTIKELNSDLHFYAQYLNFNVMSNSIPAMRWYFGQIQLGNMFLNNNELAQIYENTLPEKSNYLHYVKYPELSICELSSKVGTNYGACLNSEIRVDLNSSTKAEVNTVGDFIVEIIPDNIIVIKDTSLIMLNNRNQVVLYDGTGNKKWQLNLSSNLNGNPRVIDLENDGINEFVFFQSDQIDLIDINGKSKPGFPKKLNESSKNNNKLSQVVRRFTYQNRQ